MPSGSNRISRTATASYAEINAVQYNHPIEHSWHETQESRERTRLARCREPLALPRNTYLITSICATRATGRGGYDTVVLLQQRRGGGRGRSMIQPNSCKGCVVGRYSARERSFRCSTSANVRELACDAPQFLWCAGPPLAAGWPPWAQHGFYQRIEVDQEYAGTFESSQSFLGACPCLDVQMEQVFIHLVDLPVDLHLHEPTKGSLQLQGLQ